jgi:transcriptional regulator with XRE-family HTH domain
MARTSRRARPLLLSKLANAARRIRAESGLTLEAAGELAEVSTTSISRLESGIGVANLSTLRSLMERAYNLQGDRLEEILELGRKARSDRGFWATYGDVLPDWFETYIDLESEADTVATFDPWLVNGLLQSGPYAEALFRMANPTTGETEIKRMVDLRQQRQQRVLAGDLAVRSVMAEEVLDRPYGGLTVMADQLRLLLELSRLPRVSLQILPAGGTPPPHAGQFHVVDFPTTEDPSVVYLEQMLGAVYLRDSADVREYARMHGDLGAAARSPQDSVEMIARRLEGMSDVRPIDAR